MDIPKLTKKMGFEHGPPTDRASRRQKNAGHSISSFIDLYRRRETLSLPVTEARWLTDKLKPQWSEKC